MSTPQQYLDTSFVCDGRGRIVSTREPVPAAGPLFCLVRGVSGCAWSVHAQVPDEIAFAIDQLALAEPGTVDFSQPPVHSDEYRKLLGGSLSPRCGRKGDPFEQSG